MTARELIKALMENCELDDEIYLEINTDVGYATGILSDVLVTENDKIVLVADY